LAEVFVNVGRVGFGRLVRFLVIHTLKKIFFHLTTNKKHVFKSI
jgi:hypothetical protein